MYANKTIINKYRTNNGQIKHDDVAVGDNVVVLGQYECRQPDQTEIAKEIDISEASHRTVDTDTPVDTIIQPEIVQNVTDVPEHNIASDTIHPNDANDSSAPHSHQCHTIVNRSCKNQSLLSPADTNATTSSDKSTTDTNTTTNLPNQSTPLQSDASVDGDCAQNIPSPQQPRCNPSTFARCF